MRRVITPTGSKTTVVVLRVLVVLGVKVVVVDMLVVEEVRDAVVVKEVVLDDCVVVAVSDVVLDDCVLVRVSDVVLEVNVLVRVSDVVLVLCVDVAVVVVALVVELVPSGTEHWNTVPAGTMPPLLSEVKVESRVVKFARSAIPRALLGPILIVVKVAMPSGPEMPVSSCSGVLAAARGSRRRCRDDDEEEGGKEVPAVRTRVAAVPTES